MKRAAGPMVLAFLLAGCLGGPTENDPDPTAPTTPQPVATSYFLRAAYKMSTDPPTKATPDRVTANPMVNGFANEDLRVFESEPLAAALNVTRVHLVAFYEVVAPTVDPFPVTSNPQQARQIVFWIGSRGVFPASVSTTGDTVLVPNRVYRAEADIPLPQPGWIVPKGEPLQVLVATLAVNDRGAELRFLVDATSTPSRIEIHANATELAVPANPVSSSKDYEVLGNSGLFTGATADRVPSRIRAPIEVRPNDTYLEIRVLFRSNAGGKSDLDFDLFGPNGKVVAVSSTPYQSETVRMFAPNIEQHGAGTYQAEIVAYSGTNTKFSLETVFGPRG